MQKIKHFVESEKGKDILIVLIVILVGLASFGLGRLSKSDSGRGIKIEYTDQGANVLSASQFAQNAPEIGQMSTSTEGKAFFASSRGKKYYSLGCSAGKSIKQENRIYFATSEAAESAGYTASASCN